MDINIDIVDFSTDHVMAMKKIAETDKKRTGFFTFVFSEDKGIVAIYLNKKDLEFAADKLSDAMLENEKIPIMELLSMTVRKMLKKEIENFGKNLNHEEE